MKPKRKGRGGAGSGGGIVALIKSIVSSYVKDQHGKSAPASKPRNAAEAFAQRGSQAPLRDVFGAQATSIEPPNRPPMPSAPGMEGRINPMARLRVPGADPQNLPPLPPPPSNSGNYSRLTRSMGASILRLGPNVHPDIQRAALDAVEGTGNYKSEKQLLNILREAKGVEQSGAGAMNSFARSARSNVRYASRIATLVSVADHGGLFGGVAKAALVEEAFDKIGEIVQSKAAEKLFTKIADKIVGDPLVGERLFRAVGRGFRVGGEAAAYAMMGYETLMAVGEDWRAGANADRQSYRTARRLKIDVELHHRLRQQITAETISGRNAIDETRDGVSMDGETKELISQRTQSTMSAISVMRSNPGAFGVDVSKVLAETAKRLNVNISQLTPRQRQRAIDEALDAKRHNLVDKNQVLLRLAADGITDPANGSRYTGPEATIANARADERFQARVAAKFDEMSNDTAGSRLEEIEDRLELADKYRESLSREQIYKLDRQAEERQARARADRTRHAVKIQD